MVSGLALAANIAVLVYQLYTMRKTGRNPLKEELYTHLPAYQKVAALKHAPHAASEAQPTHQPKPSTALG